MWKYQIKERMITTSSPPEETLRCQDHDSRRTGYEMPHGYAACGLAVWFILSDLLNCTVEYPAPPRPAPRQYAIDPLCGRTQSPSLANASRDRHEIVRIVHIWHMCEWAQVAR